MITIGLSDNEDSEICNVSGLPAMCEFRSGKLLVEIEMKDSQPKRMRRGSWR